MPRACRCRCVRGCFADVLVAVVNLGGKHGRPVNCRGSDHHRRAGAGSYCGHHPQNLVHHKGESMSIIEELHTAHKARLRKIDGAGLRSSSDKPMAPPYVPTASDEIAWTIAVEGFRPSTRLTIKQIRRAVCSHFGVLETDLMGRRRPIFIMIPRQVAYYLCATLTLNSWPEIGRRLGGRDHTTCLYGYKKIKAQIADDEWLRNAVAEISDGLAGKDVFDQRAKRTVLDPQSVREIRASKEPHWTLSVRYGVGVQTIKNVRRRQTWSNVS